MYRFFFICESDFGVLLTHSLSKTTFGISKKFPGCFCCWKIMDADKKSWNKGVLKKDRRFDSTSFCATIYQCFLKPNDVYRHKDYMFGILTCGMLRGFFRSTFMMPKWYEFHHPTENPWCLTVHSVRRPPFLSTLIFGKNTTICESTRFWWIHYHQRN